MTIPILRTVLPAMATVALLLGSPGAAGAAINMDFSPNTQTVGIGATVSVQFRLASDNGANQLAAAAEIVLGWDPTKLKLTGISQTGATGLLSSGFPFPDPYGLNEVNPPADGTGYYQAYALLGSPIVCTPGGTLITTLKFTALAATAGTPVAMLPSGGSPVLHTRVFDGTQPNTLVTGTVDTVNVTITPEPGTLGLLGCLELFGLRRR